METKDKIVEIANNLQVAINSTANALIVYNDSAGALGGADLETKIAIYQAMYGQFSDLVLPFVLKRLE